MTISWVDSSDVFHSSIYSLDGDTLIRDDDGIVTPVAKSVVSADFSLSGRVLTLDLTVNSGNGGTTLMTLKTYLRVLPVMTSFFRGQRGVAMIMVIAFMALSIPMITGALSLSGTLSSDSTVKTEILKRQYSALGGDQFGGYLAPIHRTGACERPAEETKGCAFESGIMV